MFGSRGAAMQLVPLSPSRVSRPPDPAAGDRLTLAYGPDLFARLEGRGGMPFSSAWLDERMMECSMADEAVKVQLFRFIDVLPLLTTPEELCRHVLEYFE